MDRLVLVAVALLIVTGVVFTVAGQDRARGPYVTLAFDDGYKSQVYAAKALHDRGVPGVFFIPVGQLNGSFEGIPTMSRADVELVAHQGHEIGGHTYLQTNLSTLDENGVHQSLSRNRQALRGMGLDPISFAYPHGAGTEYDDVVAAYYDFGRALGWGVNTLPLQNPYRLNAISITEDNAAVLDEHLARLEPGEWLIISLHHIDSTGPVARPTIDVSQATFEQVLDQVQAADVTVTTIEGGPWND